MSLMANPVDLEHYLEKASFPSGKSGLIQYAESHHAEQPIINSLNTLPERQYESAADAARETWIPEDSDKEHPMGADSADDD